VNRKRADKCDPKEASTVLSVNECWIHVYSSKEEDTPLRRKLGRDHQIAVTKELR
jgi:hypothetical protein